jgi:hypothetical protein
MSQGAPIWVNYESSLLGTNHPILIQPETLDPRIGSQNNGRPLTSTGILQFRAGGDRRPLGLHCRMFNFRFLDGAEPEGYAPGVTLSLPWLRNNSFFRRLVRGSEGSYLNSPIVFTGRLPELAR